MHLLMRNSITLLELLFVMVVVGILSTIVIPQTKINPLQEAALQIVSDIKYTRHLALTDDTYDATNLDSNGNPKWYKERWQIYFSANSATDYKYGYTIFSDTSGNSTGQASSNEIALDPSGSGRYMTGGFTGGSKKLYFTDSSFNGMKELNIGHTYGITNVSLSGGCSYNRLSFDHLGRPFKGDHSTMSSSYHNGRLIVSNCIITITKDNQSIQIVVEPETGYPSVVF